MLKYFSDFLGNFTRYPKVDILINPDFISHYRSFLLDPLLNQIRHKKYSFRILSNKKPYLNLRMSKKYLNYDEFIASDPIFFRRFIIWQPKLLRSFFLFRPKKYIVWGEITRINTWILFILKRFFFNKTKIYLWTHGIYGRESKFLKRLRILYCNLADLILVYSSYSKKLLINNGILESKIKVIGNQLPEAKKYNLIKNNLTKSKVLNLIFVGRISPKKKIDSVIELVKNWSMDEQFMINLTLIGPNTKIKNNIRYCNSSIRYIPEIYDPKELNHYFSQSDYGICPDNVGLFILSCIFTGIPIITHHNLAFHGPEASALKNNVNMIKINFPVNMNDLKIKLKIAYELKKQSKFSPLEIRKTLPKYFETNYPENLIGEII